MVVYVKLVELIVDFVQINKHVLIVEVIIT